MKHFVDFAMHHKELQVLQLHYRGEQNSPISLARELGCFVKLRKISINPLLLGTASAVVRIQIR